MGLCWARHIVVEAMRAGFMVTTAYKDRCMRAGGKEEDGYGPVHEYKGFSFVASLKTVVSLVLSLFDRKFSRPNNSNPPRVSFTHSRLQPSRPQ